MFRLYAKRSFRVSVLKQYSHPKTSHYYLLRLNGSVPERIGQDHETFCAHCNKYSAVVCFVEKFSFLVKKGVYFVNIMLISWWAKSLKLLSSYRFDVKNKASVFVWKTRKRIQTFFYLWQKFQITNENAMTSTSSLLLLFFSSKIFTRAVGKLWCFFFITSQ